MQTSLFDAPLGRRFRKTDPQTSRDAAKGTEVQILEMFTSPMTDDELASRLPFLYPPTVKSARSRLSKRGLLVDSGSRRPSLRGRDQIVWEKR